MSIAKNISTFQGAHRFLSNFWIGGVEIKTREGVSFNHVEGAYQASKAWSSTEQADFVGLTPRQCKLLGRSITIRPDWEESKVGIMLDLLRQKFRPGSALAKRLLSTGEAVLVEGNSWGDRFWGQCPLGNGRNELGKLLMLVRDELRCSSTSIQGEKGEKGNET